MLAKRALYWLTHSSSLYISELLKLRATDNGIVEGQLYSARLLGQLWDLRSFPFWISLVIEKQGSV